MQPQNSNGDTSFGRITRGEQIAKEKVISENADGNFSIPSQTVDEIAYLVRMIDGNMFVTVWISNTKRFDRSTLASISARQNSGSPQGRT